MRSFSNVLFVAAGILVGIGMLFLSSTVVFSAFRYIFVAWCTCKDKGLTWWGITLVIGGFLLVFCAQLCHIIAEKPYYSHDDEL
jgi:hypothetical protein